MSTHTLQAREKRHKRINLNRGCLALNASYEPLTVLSQTRAIRLVLEGRAEILERDGTKVVRSESEEIPCPAVIRLSKYVHVPRRFRRTVSNTFLFARDQATCQYCGRSKEELGHREFLTRDHVVPVSRGGENSWENCVTACRRCNARKADRTPEEAGMRLLHPPTEPHFVKLVWTVRKLTPLQKKWVTRFFGSDIAEMLDAG